MKNNANKQQHNKHDTTVYNINNDSAQVTYKCRRWVMNNVIE